MSRANYQTHRVCPWWLTYTFDNPLRPLLHRPERLFAELVQPGQRALDLGCGFGFFSLGLARLLGPQGRVLAVDLQEQALRRVRARAAKAGMDGRIRTHRCRAEALDLPLGPEAAESPEHGVEPGAGAPLPPPGGYDFALAFWMAHEVPDQPRLFGEIHAALNPGGLFYLAEPRLDTTRRYFCQELERVEGAGFRLLHRPPVRFSLAAVFTRV